MQYKDEGPGMYRFPGVNIHLVYIPGPDSPYKPLWVKNGVGSTDPPNFVDGVRTPATNIQVRVSNGKILVTWEGYTIAKVGDLRIKDRLVEYQGSHYLRAGAGFYKLGPDGLEDSALGRECLVTVITNKKVEVV